MAPSISKGFDCNSSQAAIAKKTTKADKKSPEYRLRRDRNNIAVKKSRTKMRMQAKETLEKVNRLKIENVALESKVQLLTKELELLRDLLLSYARGATYQPGWPIEEHATPDDGGPDDTAVVPVDEASEGGMIIDEECTIADENNINMQA